MGVSSNYEGEPVSYREHSPFGNLDHAKGPGQTLGTLVITKTVKCCGTIQKWKST